MFYFRNGGHEEVYLSSADWMQRNLSKRLELLFPVVDPKHRRRLIEALEVYFADNVKAWRLLSDGTYEKVAARGRGSGATDLLQRGGGCGPQRRPRDAAIPSADAAEGGKVARPPENSSCRRKSPATAMAGLILVESDLSGIDAGVFQHAPHRRHHGRGPHR